MLAPTGPIQVESTHVRRQKKPRVRAVKNEIKPIPAPAEKIAQTIFFAADKKIAPKVQ